MHSYISLYLRVICCHYNVLGLIQFDANQSDCNFVEEKLHELLARILYREEQH